MATGSVAGRVDSKLVQQAAAVIQRLLAVDVPAAKKLATELKADPSAAARICAEAARQLGSLTEVTATSHVKMPGFFAPQTPQAFKDLCANVLANPSPQGDRESYFRTAESIVAEAVA